MYRPLLPCPGCARHVRATEATCPFCATAQPEVRRDVALPAPAQRLGRAATFVFGATLAISGCASTANGADSGPGPADAQGDSSDSGMDQPDDQGNTAPAYGLPAPEDAGADVPDGPDDNGGSMAEYGAPPPDDAG